MLKNFLIPCTASYRQRRSLIQVTGAIAVLLLSSACQTTNSSNGSNSGNPSSPAATGKVLKLGTLLPITGDLAQYGKPMQDAASLLVKTVNACGGVLGQPVQLVSEDDQTEPAAGAAAMTKLAEVDRVSAVIGGASSAVSAAAVDIAVRNRVIQISPSSTSPVFTERARKGDFQEFWFRTAPPDTFQGEALAKLAQQKGYKSVNILAINNDYGKGLATSFNDAFKALGGQVATSPTFYPPDAASFESEVSAAFNDQPDAVLVVAYPETGSLVLKAAYQQGMLGKKTAVLVTDGMKETNIARTVGKNAQGQFLATGIVGTAPSSGGPALSTFQKLYQAAYQRQPSVYDPNTWDAAAAIVLASEAAKSTDPTVVKTKIRDVVNAPGQEVSDVCQALDLVRQGQDINYQGASGTVEFDAQGDVVGSYDIWTIAPDGSLKVTDAIKIGGS